MVIFAEDSADQFQFKRKGNIDVLDPINQSMFCARQVEEPAGREKPSRGKSLLDEKVLVK